ncbi:DEAD/DEAH box helicase [Kitasatospora sp. DSM 101779]|uniref:DEAD/DEAH box helicase n=1 Tax=Kitasatospora sp. DSM 101779 TaxID=2853165 RepID=UPI0021D8C8C4|nr:DEAD/DEAH box helicase [Kitasatospora sp. DSM 101779]MCU7824043.1 DEAD/DEAH box helicase [Kitasatospora sp. DSM 101779]
MDALHALWQDGGRLALWAESGAAYRDRPTRTAPGPGGGPAAHPYAFPAAATARLLAGLGPGPGWLAAQAAERWTTLHLPSLGGAPAASPQLPAGTRPQGAAPTPWRVPVLVLEGPHTAQLLGALFDPHRATAHCQPDDGPATEIAYGSSLRWLTAVHDLAWRMVGRGRVLPALREADGTPYACWRPAPDAEDRAEAAALATGCPRVCLATDPAAAAGRRRADTLLADALDTLTDLEARAALADLPTPPGDDPWLTALHAPDGRLDTVPDGLAERLAAWHARVPADPAVRLVLRLVEPLGPTEEEPEGRPDDDWRIDLLLRAADRPSLLVPAADLWTEGPGHAALARTVPQPAAALAAELDRAALLYPALRATAREIRPTGLALDRAGALAFLRDAAPELDRAGFGILLPAWWQRRPRLGLTLTARTATPGAVDRPARIDRDDLLAFRWQAALGDTPLTEGELAELAAAQQGLVRLRGRWTEVDTAQIRAAHAFLTRHATGTMDRADLLRLALDDTAHIAGLPVTAVHADGPIGDLLAGRAGSGPARTSDEAAPPGFHGELRPYQRRGTAWLHALGRLGLGAVLADDMGLGKTVQTLALLAREHAEGATGPILLVCPTSMVGTWQREAARFTPGLRVRLHHGPDRGTARAAAATADLVVTSYDTVRRDAADLGSVRWRRIVADEAQAVKNTATDRSRALRSLPSGPRIALTGTPVENRLAELHAVLDFANPGLFGSAESFRERFAVPVEQNANPAAAERLRRLAGPFLLRRVKSDPAIALDLPAKQEFTVPCGLTAEQAGLYRAVVDDLLQRLDGVRGVERKGAVLSALGRLKQVCNHPAQLVRDRGPLAGRSGKIDRLEEILAAALAGGERTLVFSQYTEFTARLRPHLAERLGTEVLHLHGGTPRAERERLVRRFQEPDGPGVFLLSLRAGGTGLTLTAANQVVHLDRWWNPAVEDQATDRVHRIGQRRGVQVRRLVCTGTVEERIADLIEAKRTLADTVVGEGEQWLTELSSDALRDLLTLSADAIGA